MSLRATDLRRHFQGRDVVAGASLAVKAGDFVALMGQSGSGKTTLLQMIGLLDRPDAGVVEVGDVDAWALGSNDRAHLRLSHFGFVFQERNLLDHLDTRDNVALPAWRLSGSRRRALDRADALLESLGLAERRRARVMELSTGEAQRATIARALINEPKVVLADEPTGSLDSKTTAAVLDALETVRSHGAALLVVTHDPLVAERADTIITMRDGKLFEDD